MLLGRMRQTLEANSEAVIHGNAETNFENSFSADNAPRKIDDLLY